MKKWIILVVLSVVCAVILSVMRVAITTEKQVIYIEGGEPVLADSINQTDQFVFYEVDGKSGMFMNDDVTSVGSIQVKKKASVLAIIDQNKRKIMTKMGFGPKAIGIADSRLIILLLVLIMLGTISLLIRKLVGVAREKVATRTTGEGGDSTPEPSGHLSQDEEKSSDLRNIAMFFLELYKLQKGVGREAPGRFSMTADSTARKMKVFELGIKGSSDWLTRRMSIGPLGEDTGSKSKCFYVIYDTHMVVKIPPIAVTDIEKYVGAIRREVQIASQLSPVACIIPMASVVLKKVKSLPYESSLTQEQLEKQYIRLVEESPEYQEYLKIGDRFAFFMELTNSFFLGRVINELHESREKTGDELRESPDVAWNQEAFTARYGLAALPVFEELQTLYRLCENEIKRIIKDAGASESIHTFQIKNWFLACIAGESLDHQGNGMDSALMSEIENGFSTIFKSNQKYVDDLIQLLKAQMARKTFTKSRQQIENISFNVLQLLCLLKEKRIALRDLKPDNLFLDANPDDYPVFLNNLEDFAIGVIDVETAISLTPNRDGTIAQPLLGGTPLYATPLHLLKNHTIAANFGDLADALHLQDWFATIAIIFRTITGRNLFPRAARSFPAILKILKAGGSKSDPNEATVRAMSKKFWSAASTDIKSHLTTFSYSLSQLTLSIPEAMVTTIKTELEREEACLHMAIGKHVSFSPLFKSEKNRKFLLEASSDAIARQVARWQSGRQLPDQHRKVAPQMVAFLNNLKRLKNGAADKRQAIAAIASPQHRISAYALIEAMFQIAFKAMYKSRWKALPEKPGASAQKSAVEDNRSMVTTILNEN
jgi:serine/threonine protein kinase